MRSPRWTTVQESEFAWEREALEYLRAELPDHEPFRAWANFEFIADDGSINEVDLLVVSLHRIYLVEIKSAPGRVEGDAGTWRWTDEGRVRHLDNPLLLANRKAKKLKSLLVSQPAIKNVRLPYVEAVVFLSNPGVKCNLDGPARQNVLLRGGKGQDGYPDIIRVLSGATDGGEYGRSSSRVDAPLSRAVARALDQAGIRPPQQQRQVGDYILDSLLNETDVFQEWEAHHVRFEQSRRRIRIYPSAVHSAEVTRTERRAAAEREYRLLEGITHTGILRVELFTEHERGPALVFEHPEDAERLDFFLQRRLKNLDQKQRLELVRQLAETIKYAHSRRLFHQALSPQSILVAEAQSEWPVLKIFNWQVGHSDDLPPTETRVTVGHIHRLGLAGEQQGVVYLAPEQSTVGTLDPSSADVFSLGALAYHMLSGRPPAATLEELHEKLKRADGLRLSEVLDGANQDLEDLLAVATAPDTSQRWEISEFVDMLGSIIGSLHQPEPGRFVHPLEAAEGDELEGGIIVKQRLGKGSTAVAWLVESEGKDAVLKIALDPVKNDRIEAEAEVLQEIRHQNIVGIRRLMHVSGHAAILMDVAGTRKGTQRPGTYTLAQRIREEGRLSLDLLQRFGEELLSVVDWLERKGISHRDIKPDNIGIGETGNKTLTLILFDFSLSGTPSENIRAGTPPYLDPFLSLRKPPRWDPYAERFAAAVTLYEMATGYVPVWGDGRSNPALIKDEVSLEVELFDAAVREDLSQFFRKALSRDYAERHDNAEEMLRSWRRIFERIDHSTTHTDEGDLPDLDAVLAGAEESTHVSALPLSPRVLNALERMGAHTIKEFLELPRIRLYRNKGIGQRTVKEIRNLSDRVARQFAEREPAEQDTEPVVAEQDPRVEPHLWSIDLIKRRLLPQKADPDDVAILRRFLGLDDGAVLWPAQQDVAEALAFPREDVRAVIESTRVRWSKDKPAWAVPLRDDVARLLDRHGGVMTREELLTAILSARGSAVGEPHRQRNAAAVTYAAIEMEADREGARFVLFRGSEHTFLVATPLLGENYVVSPAARARYAERLGAKADELAEADPLLGEDRAVEDLRKVAALEEESLLPDERLLRLAVAAGKVAALSSRREIYPRGMSGERALRLAASSLNGPRSLSPDEVMKRVAGRYPLAQPLPGRPDLDELLKEAAPQLTWVEAEGRYLAPIRQRSYLFPTSTISRYSTTTSADLDAPEAAESHSIDQRLETISLKRRVLVLAVDPSLYTRARDELVRRFELEAINLESLILRAMRETARSLDVKWDVVLRADAADRTGRDWRRLRQLVDRSMKFVEEELLALRRPALLLYPGLLARFDHLDLIERLRDAAESGRAPGYALLVPTDGQQAMPVIDGKTLPVVHASDWARLSRFWVQNRHRGRVPASASV